MGIAITWTGYMNSSGSNPGNLSPSAYCLSQGMVAADWYFGYPTQWRCYVAASGSTTWPLASMPSCPSGYYADFSNEVCMPDASSGGGGGGGLPPASDIAAVWSAAFSIVVLCFLIGRAVGAVLEFIRKG